jgi:hypothetical protein
MLRDSETNFFFQLNEFVGGKVTNFKVCRGYIQTSGLIILLSEINK